MGIVLQQRMALIMQKALFLVAAAFIGGSAALVSPAQAASFDCTRAQSPDEVAVCKHHKLSALDSEMGALWSTYKQFPLAMGMSGNRQDEATQFLQQRQACGGNVGCLKSLYQARIKTLKDDIKWAIQQATQDAGGGPISAPSPKSSPDLLLPQPI
ncbi:lysozyme inhibitor LprI family protein [Rhodoligotrophos ferricapiens]|uniref:lysozyme inhibitor LprI family protein n=1 Tax=Rhodoligotrophos ferricapiens TaxID=3069264 RepID=UPI00315C8506